MASTALCIGKSINATPPAYDHEVAGVVAMLCSEDGGWSTESMICAYGGLKFMY